MGVSFRAIEVSDPDTARASDSSLVCDSERVIQTGIVRVLVSLFSEVAGAMFGVSSNLLRQSVWFFHYSELAEEQIKSEMVWGGRCGRVD